MRVSTRQTPQPSSARLLYHRKEAARQLSIGVRSLNHLIARKQLGTRYITTAQRPMAQACKLILISFVVQTKTQFVKFLVYDVGERGAATWAREIRLLDEAECAG